MKIRISISGLLAVALGAFGTAVWGGPAHLAGMVQAQAAGDPDLPAWVLALPEGTPPRDNGQTNTAFIALSQARTTTNEGQRRTRYQSALTAANAGIEADPTNPQSYLQAGEAHLGLGDLTAARGMFARATEMYPRYVLDVEMILESAWVEHFNRGVEALQANRRPDAFAAFQQANGVYDGRPEGFVEAAAIILEDQSRVQEVIDLYTKASDAIFARRARDDSESEAIFEEWRDYLEVALFNRAHFLFTTDRFAEASDVYVLILETFPEENGVVPAAILSFSESGRVEQYVPVMEGILARDGLPGEVYMSLGAAFYGAERMDLASDAFGKLHALHPEDRNALSNYALTLYLANEAEELIAAAEKLLALEPYDQAPYRFLVNALAQSGRDQEAMAILNRMEALPYDFAGVNLVATPTGGAFLGQVTNTSAAPNATVRVRLHIIGTDGARTVTDPLTVTLGARGTTVPFEIPVSMSPEFAGYRYEVLE